MQEGYRHQVVNQYSMIVQDVALDVIRTQPYIDIELCFFYYGFERYWIAFMQC